MCPTGGDVIHEVVVLMRANALTGRLAQAVHAYPAWALAVREVRGAVLPGVPGSAGAVGHRRRPVTTGVAEGDTDAARDGGRDAEALLRLPFDHYGRYRLAADVVEATRNGEARRILDLGGGPGSLQRFLPGDAVVASDVAVPDRWHAAAPSLVVADGAALPFPDDAFDVVVTLDTLEHVRPERREALLREVVRAARSWAVVVCPCATDGVAEADAALLGIVRRRFGDAFPTVTVLEEHLTFGHPDPDVVAGTLRAAGAEVARVPSGRIDRWLPMMLVFFDLLQLGDDAPVEAVQAWYNRRCYRDDLRAPAYRQAFLCRLPGAQGPSLDDVVAAVLPPERADDGGAAGPGDVSPGKAASATGTCADDGFTALRAVLTAELGRVALDRRRRLDTVERELHEARAALHEARAALPAAHAGTERARAEAAGLTADLRAARDALDAACTERDRDREEVERLRGELAGLRDFRERVLTHPLLQPLLRTRRGLRHLRR